MLKRIFVSLLPVLFITTASHAADNSFTGKWKLNPEKSILHDEMKVASAGANRYAFDFGGGDPEYIVVDGTDQSSLDGSTLAVTSEGSQDRKSVV